MPIQMAQKVISLDKVYGAGAEVSFTLYQNQEIPILNVKRRIFGAANPQYLLPQSGAATNNADSQYHTKRFLLIMKSPTGELVGLPLDSPPSLRRISESAFMPLSATYLESGQIRCIKCLIVPDPEQPPIFLLDLDQLFQAQTALPGANQAM